MSNSKQRRSRPRRSPTHGHDVGLPARSAVLPDDWWHDTGLGSTVAAFEGHLMDVPAEREPAEAWAREADFFALDLSFRCAHPRCPDCGADWCHDLTDYGTTSANGSERSVWLSTRCSAYERDLVAGRVPGLHTYARAGVMRFSYRVS